MEEALAQGAYISAANWAEVLIKVAEIGEDPEALANRLEEQGLLNHSLEVLPLTEEDEASDRKCSIF